MNSLLQLGLRDAASECAVDALRRQCDSCSGGGGDASVAYTQLLLDVVGREALPALSPTDFAQHMYHFFLPAFFAAFCCSCCRFILAASDQVSFSFVFHSRQQLVTGTRHAQRFQRPA